MSKKINVRTQHKIDTYENWSKAENFVPLKGELIIYTTDESGNEIVKLKIGDGKTKVNDLPFAVGGSATDEPGLALIQSDWAQTDSTQPDYIKNKIGDYQKDLREFNDITFGNYAGTRPFYMWNNVLSNIDTLKDLDEGVILNVYQNGNLIDSQKFLLNPTLDSSFLSSSETGYWVLINATKTTEEILGGSAWEEKNPDYSTFNMGFIKNDTTGIVYVIAGAPNDELVGQSFSFELDFTNTTKQLIKLPWEVISNKPGDVGISESYYDTFNLASCDEYNEQNGLFIFAYEKYNPFTKKIVNIFLKNKIDGNIIEFNNCEISSFELEGVSCYEILINTTTSFMDFFAAEGAIPFEKIDSTLPSLLIVCVKENQMTQIICDISDYANYEVEIFEIEDTIISLPDSTLSEEFLNIDGKLHLAYGKLQTETIENDTEASLALGTPLQQQGNPFLMWRNIYTIENYPYDLLKDKVQISYINSNNEQIIFDKERNPLLLELNSTLDQAFNIGTNNLGHWGIFNSKQTIMELFEQLQSGGNVTLEKYEENEPAVIVVLSQNQENKNIYITLVSLENIHEIYSNNFIINILNEQINETILKLPKEALPDDLSTEVEMVQSNYAENDETKDSYIQNRPFYDYPVQEVNFPRTFEKFTWDGNTEGKIQIILIEDEVQTPQAWYKISDNFIPEEKLLNSFVTINSADLGEDNIRLASQISPISNTQTGTIGYEICVSEDGSLFLPFIYEVSEVGTYLTSNGYQYYFPEVGIYTLNFNGQWVESWEGFYDLESEELIKVETQSDFLPMNTYIKYVSEEIPEKEDWYYSYLKYLQITKYKAITGEMILDDTSVLEDLQDKYGSYSLPPLILVIKTPNESIEISDGTFITFEKTGIYMVVTDLGDNYFMSMDLYQLYNKIDKKYIYPITVETYNKIAEGNTKPVSSGAVWTALGGRSSIYIDDENLPQSGSQKLMTSNAIYKAFEQMNQNKQDTLTILDTVQENSDGIVKSSGIYNAIEEIKNDVPTATSQLTNDSNFIDESQLDSAVQEVMNVANGKRASYVFKDVNELNTFIASNQDSLKIGDIFLLTDTGLPDYWWTGSDIAILETNIDLDNYYNQNEVDTLLSENHYTKQETNSLFAQNLGGLIFRKAYSSQISNPTEGTIYYNVNDKTIQTYSGGSWSSAVAADPNTIYFVVEG